MALAIPPKIRAEDIGVMPCLELEKKEIEKIINLHKRFTKSSQKRQNTEF